MHKVALWLLCTISSAVLANVKQQSVIEDRVVRHAEQTIQKQMPDTGFWGITKEEYTKYESLMKNSPALKWYKQLDPAEVLGIMAENEADRMKYARIIARLHKERVDRELVFQNAFNKAFEELYPNLKPISGDEKLTAASNAIFQPGDQILAFISVTSGESHLIASLLQKQKDNPLVTLNFYLLDSKNDSEIQAWARKYQIPVAEVKSGQITLNDNEGRFAQMVGKNAKPPVVLLSRRGALSPMDTK